ncbi:MAG: polyribonucleotide nucleotidyltransferase [Verrucomicrobia bacterium]|nr:polyribonucleotide nucleotidyltransferase [Verrucomicrobiota bacterium]
MELPMFDKKSTVVSVGGRDIIFETGKIARQANAAVVVRSGETILLSTACSGPAPSAETDFLPLRVDYQEKFSSAGKTLGGFIKREGRPAEREILVCRLIDRPLRPMFEDGYYNEIQVLSYVFSYDGIHSPDPLAICAASAALTISDIPLIKPVGAVRVGLIDNNFVVNPTVEEQKKSRLDLILAGTEDAILMIEGYCDFLTEEQILEAVEEGHQAIKKICQCLSDWQKVIGKPKKRDDIRLIPEELIKEMKQLTEERLDKALRQKEKQAREDAVRAVNDSVTAHFFPEGETTFRFTKTDVKGAFKKVQSHLMRKMILDENERSDGRKCDQIRPIDIELSLLPRTHGSALFTRGETQSLAVATLGGETMAQRAENLDGEANSRFYLQYSFPPFSVGEVGRMGSPGRREIGHGKLAERSLAMILPPQENFPYVIRLESNITESNGSSSMASVCGGCLALMDAGVPIRRPIAGIAMGLILEDHKYAILSDILGVEDALGDMDFKLSGDAQGITAFQLDIKIEGINSQIMKAALAQAKQGRLHILNKMLEICPKSKEHLSSYAPRIETMQIKPSKIGTVIGPAGKQIRAIIEETGVQIDIDDSGLVSISSTNSEGMKRAKEIIHNLTAEVEIGKTYTGRVVSIVPFGIFVEIYGKEGLCHISELSHARVQNIQDVVKEGQMIDVKVLDVNDRGQIKLSHKAVLPAPAAAQK